MIKNKLSWLLLSACLSGSSYMASAQELQSIKLKNAKQLKAYFRYGAEKAALISGHRGGMIKGFPENSIATFENTLRATPAFFEIDPRLSKDSVAVLMHDETLNRTTNGKGKVSDYTYEELQQFRLKDPEGNVTNHKIPTLKEVITWSKGKTVMNLDKKDLPLELTAKILSSCKNDIVMLTVHNAEQAKFYYKYNPKWMLSAFVKSKKAFKEYEDAGIPWENMIAYIGSTNKPENKELFDMLHAKGVMCMISAAPSYDKLPKALERAKHYRDTFIQGADILESDLPIEVAAAVKGFSRGR